MTVELLLPGRRAIAIDELRGWMEAADSAPPFDPSIVDACAGLSQRILHDAEARQYPELAALGFWIRKAEIQRLHEEFLRLSRPDRILVPRGRVFHLPPRNVDTIFVYSWLLSALTGNCNVIRLSPLRSASTNVLLRLFDEALAAAGEPARSSTLVVGYGHEDEPTAALSSLCDVRVIWGGDRTVATIRRLPLPPHARELAFPDRQSLSAIRAESYQGLDEEGRDCLAGRFFNDAFWFDQIACSSPRLLVWCGEAAAARAASADFFPRLAACVRRRRYVPAPAHSMQKLVFSASAILGFPVIACRRWPELTVLTLDSLDRREIDHPGGGLFFEAYLPALDELAPSLVRKSQTLACFGFEDEELRGLIRLLNGRAIDRVVPIGHALQFGRFWDGHDLLQEFCRQIYIESAQEVPPNR